ncbi:MAG: wax ester/triacylglycerol synthase family O-acyltransferase [Gammaproteobacteria bacterium]|nr:wax ester/triacylglycerol synthase family O-acyltransferase [Gammaproteobacteria bacterium]
MQQLTGLDASFLYLETPNAPMHISGLAIYDQSTAPGGKVRFKQIIENTAQRIRRLPALTRRLVTVPLGLDHPYWIADGSFDPEFHIRHIALPAPGDWRQLCILISRIHARPLDRGHPLWELYVIEGLDNMEGYPNNCFAIFTKMHHAAVDGASGMEITAATHDLSPVVAQPSEPYSITVDQKPGTLGLLARAQLNTLKQPFRFVSVARNTVPGFARLYSRLRRGELQRVKNIPRTRFNDAVSAHRVFDAVTFPLQDIKDIKNTVSGTTVNDVAITICGGALRKYLLSKDELPEASLAAMAPINVRDSAEKGKGGNIVSTMTVPVRSDIEDAMERLRAVHEGTSQAKEYANAVGAKTMTDYTQFIPSTLTALAARLASRWGLLNQMDPLYNCVITNVPGPQVPLYNTGARMIANFGTGPVQDGLGLFHVIGSYCGDFTISATACREMMPDPEFYRDCLNESFAELKKATAKTSPKKAESRTRKSASRRRKKAA